MNAFKGTRIPTCAAEHVQYRVRSFSRADCPPRLWSYICVCLCIYIYIYIYMIFSSQTFYSMSVFTQKSAFSPLGICSVLCSILENKHIDWLIDGYACPQHFYQPFLVHNSWLSHLKYINCGSHQPNPHPSLHPDLITLSNWNNSKRQRKTNKKLEVSKDQVRDKDKSVT